MSRRPAPTATTTDATAEVVVSEERLTTGTVTETAGSVRARKHVETQPYSEQVQRGTEHAEVETHPVLEEDSGQVLTLEDGSVSIPVFEEQVVVTKRLVVRERVVLRKHTVYEQHTVTADLRREHLEVTSDGDAVVRASGDPTS